MEAETEECDTPLAHHENKSSTASVSREYSMQSRGSRMRGFGQDVKIAV